MIIEIILYAFFWLILYAVRRSDITKGYTFFKLWHVYAWSLFMLISTLPLQYCIATIILDNK